ncbi:hypothetical protein USDA257_p06200 (plasmid) [Sinorhizobium fredii USDA 257]|uniref:Uncharacterized protein n=1 Tax=Sinorhizobium fredii (strain USDA 257) TaxID=1185652 RepID=I3XHH9_SINF2|nr:hypothetical protein USDA257_p06200 [Sinorhizobium fredii USDA 257]
MIKREVRGANRSGSTAENGARQARISPSTSKRQLGKRPCAALVKDGATIASGFVPERKPTSSLRRRTVLAWPDRRAHRSSRRQSSLMNNAIPAVFASAVA